MDEYYSDDEFAIDISDKLTYGTVYKLTKQAEETDSRQNFDHIVFERIFCVDEEGNVVGRDHNSVIILGGNVDVNGKFIPLKKSDSTFQFRLSLSNITYHFRIGNIFINDEGQLQFKPAFFFDRKRIEKNESHITGVLDEPPRIQPPRIQPDRALPRRVDFSEPEVYGLQGVSTRTTDHDYNKDLRRARKSSRGEGCDSNKYNFLRYPLSRYDQEKINIYYRKRRLAGQYVPGGQPYGFNSKGFERDDDYRRGGTKKYKHSRKSKRKIKTMKRRKKKSRKRR